MLQNNKKEKKMSVTVFQSTQSHIALPDRQCDSEMTKFTVLQDTEKTRNIQE